MRRILLFSLCLFAYLIYVQPVQAATIDVTPNTIKTTLQSVNAGDTIRLRSGNYSPVVLGRAGYTVTNYPNERPVFDGGSTNIQLEITGTSIEVKGNILFTNAKWAAIRASDTSQDITIDGVEVSNTKSHSIMAAGKNITIKNSYVHDSVLENLDKTVDNSWGSCIKGERNVDGLNIIGNTVERCHGEGIATTMTKNALIKNNKVYSSWAVGIYIDNVDNVTVDSNLVTCQDPAFYRSSSGSPSITGNTEDYSNWTNRFNNVSFINNIIFGCEGIAYWGDTTPPTLKILNNTILNAAKSSIYAEGSGGTIEARNNIVKSNVYNIPTQSNNLTVVSDIFATTPDPKDPTTFKLRNNVTGYNTGIASDFGGYSRSNPITVGAWQYGSTTTVSPSPSSTVKPGDFNNDNKVDIKDFNILITNFGNPYTIKDFNNLISNYTGS